MAHATHTKRAPPAPLAPGVCFTRNPATGNKELYGEYLANAQGEDVVAGIRTPLPVVQMADVFPQAYADLVANTTLLETHMRDMQDCEVRVHMGVAGGGGGVRAPAPHRPTPFPSHAATST